MKKKTGTEENKFAHSQLLGFQLSLNCPVSCRSCAYECGPGKSRALSSDDAVDILEGFSDSYKPYLMPFFGFTGGEPFLYLDTVRAISRYVQKRFGFAITISTNGFWAKDMQTARSILTGLKETGLAHLGISVDDFHQEFIGLERVKTAILAAVETDLTCHVQCAETKKSTKMEDFQNILNIRSKQITWGKTTLDPIGRAYTAIPEDDLDLNWNVKTFDFCSILKTWIINQDGNVMACCGSGAYCIPPAGNVSEESLSDIINRNNLDPLYNALAATGGPAMLIGLLTQNGHSRFSELSYTGPCHACGLIFQDNEAIRILKEILIPKKIELLTHRLLVRQQEHSFSRPPFPFMPDMDPCSRARF